MSKPERNTVRLPVVISILLIALDVPTYKVFFSLSIPNAVACSYFVPKS